MTWVSVHVHYHEDQDRLIREGVWPAVRSLHAAGLADRAFFLRYWRYGPHVRVRVRASAGTDPDQVRDRLTRRLADFVGRRQSTLALDEAVFLAAQAELAALENEPSPQCVLPDNTLVTSTYEPEYDKYGGEAGVRIAEELFDASSTTVAGLLDEIARRPGRRLLLGLAMLVAAVREFDTIEAGGFLTDYENTWRPYAIGPHRDRWTAAGARDRAAAGACVTAVLSGRDMPGTEPWTAALRKAYRSLLSVDGPMPPASRLVTHYAHTSGNRLGLLPADEAYLAYLARSVLPDTKTTGVAR